MKRTFLALAMILTAAVMWTPVLSADGCYLCGSGSSSNCRDYCRYSGSDNFENRKKCEKAGCKVSGTSSCPSAANYKVCSAFQERSISEMLLAHFQVRIQ
jgi:hypothetical protein